MKLKKGERWKSGVPLGIAWIDWLGVTFWRVK